MQDFIKMEQGTYTIKKNCCHIVLLTTGINAHLKNEIQDF